MHPCLVPPAIPNLEGDACVLCDLNRQEEFSNQDLSCKGVSEALWKFGAEVFRENSVKLFCLSH